MLQLILSIVVLVVAAGLLQCLRDKAARPRWIAYIQQMGIAWDQLINAHIPPIFTLSWADETISARTFRAARRGKIFGTFMMPIIDWMFRWQGYPNHCERAYEKELLRASLPPEYRPEPSAPSVT